MPESLLSKARICHLEDLLFFEGGEGALRALKLLIQIALGDADTLSMKVDGSPALYIGRNDNGEFVCTDKSGFYAKTYNGRFTSVDQFISRKMSRATTDEKMEKLRPYLREINQSWSLLESIVPENFRGYVKGDVMWFPNKYKINGNYILFKPNTVLYKVDSRSVLGQEILKSKMGFAVHTFYDLKTKTENPVFDNAGLLDNTNVCLLTQKKIKKQNGRLNVNINKIKRIREKVKTNKKNIDLFFNKETLQSSGLEKLPLVFYGYINFLTKTMDYSNLESRFIQWMYQNAGITNKLKVKYNDYITDNKRIVDIIFDLFIDIQQLKNEIIDLLDNKDESDLSAYVDNRKGGEGYVVTDENGPVKLVNRYSFSATNFNK